MCSCERSTPREADRERSRNDNLQVSFSLSHAASPLVPSVIGINGPMFHHSLTSGDPTKRLTADQVKVGFIGLGNMGSRIVGHSLLLLSVLARVQTLHELLCLSPNVSSRCVSACSAVADYKGLQGAPWYPLALGYRNCVSTIRKFGGQR